MQGYLTGRGEMNENSDGSKDSVFRSFLSANQEIKPDNESVSSESDLESEIIYDQANCPKVEVLSEDGVPQKILIHLEDGKILQIQCNY